MAWNKFVRGSFKGRGVRKSQSEADQVDSAGSDDTNEVEASTIQEGAREDFLKHATISCHCIDHCEMSDLVGFSELSDEGEHYMGFFGKSFGQAWHWFKERKRSRSVALNAHLTYVTLPWHRIIAGSSKKSSTN